MIQSSADRLTKLSAKWEELRGPLLQQYRDLKAESETRETVTTQLLDEMRAMRERMKEVADETRLKDDLYKQLVGCVWCVCVCVCVGGGGGGGGGGILHTYAHSFTCIHICTTHIHTHVHAYTH